MSKQPDLYADLGIEKDASPEEVKYAFRKRARQTHPDKNGKVEEFQAVAHAYSILSSPEKRQRYDRGDPLGINAQDERGEMLGFVGSMLMQIMEQVDDLEHQDLLLIIRNEIAGKIRDGEDVNRQVRKKQDRLRRMAKRLKRKAKGEENILAHMMLTEANKLDTAFQNNLEGIAKMKALLEFVEEFEYVCEPQTMSIFIRTGASTITG